MAIIQTIAGTPIQEGQALYQDSNGTVKPILCVQSDSITISAESGFKIVVYDLTITKPRRKEAVAATRAKHDAR